jgi:hypothetical protein
MAEPQNSRSDHTTTTTTTTTGGGAGMGFILGALVIAVAVLAYFMLAGGDVDTSSGGDVNVTVEGASAATESAAEAVESAGAAVEGAAEAVESSAEGTATSGN